MKLQLQRLCKQYGTKTAVDDVSAELTSGVYGLLDANGAGKTTLMWMLSRFHGPGVYTVYVRSQRAG